VKRREGEDFEQYKVRREEEKILLKQKLKGSMVWYSKNNRNKNRPFNMGTYVKPKEEK
jgi:hypothetical protein